MVAEVELFQETGRVSLDRPLRVLFTGDRNWEKSEVVVLAVALLPSGSVVIEGGARGLDSLARVVAEGLGYEVVEFPADWQKHGKRAGPIRNQQMLDEGKPDLVIAFHHELGQSRGTRDMVRRALRAGLPVAYLTGGAEDLITLASLVSGMVVMPVTPAVEELLNETERK